jgi:hypothetical protein
MRRRPPKDANGSPMAFARIKRKKLMMINSGIACKRRRITYLDLSSSPTVNNQEKR